MNRGRCTSDAAWAWASGIGSDVALTLLIWSSLAVFGLVGLIAVQLVVVRRVDAARRRRQRELEQEWLPLLVRGSEQVPDSFPTANHREMALFLSLWNRLHDSVRVDSNLSPHHSALHHEMGDAARRMLSSKRLDERLLAIVTLGRLRDRGVWHVLAPLATGRDIAISLAAARALVRIDAPAAVRLLLPMMAEREDWSPATIGLILQDAGADVISGPLADAVMQARPERAHRLIRYLGLAHAETTVPLLQLLVRRVDLPESITACLRVFTDAGDLGAVRRYLDHPRWEVRVRAVEVLGRLGTVREAERLTAKLSDSEWWVRYRAAQALCLLLSGDLDRVRRLRESHQDLFARDMLTHVLAEQGAA